MIKVEGGADAQANYYSCRSNLLELNLKRRMKMEKTLILAAALACSSMPQAETYVCSTPSGVEGFPPNMVSFVRQENATFTSKTAPFGSSDEFTYTEDPTFLLLHKDTFELSYAHSLTHLIDKITGVLKYTVVESNSVRKILQVGSCMTLE